MPNRIIREGILASKRVTQLGWAEEVFFRRLMSVVDDYGRFYADPGMLRAACYPRQLTKVSDSDVGKFLRACVDSGLVRVYPAQDGDDYLEMLRFDQQVRAKKSKFPGPNGECAADDEQMLSGCVADAHLDGDVVEDDTPPPPTGGVPHRKRQPLAERPADVSEGVWNDFAALRKAKRAPLTVTALSGIEREAKKVGWSLEQALAKCIDRSWQGFQSEWLQQAPRSTGNSPWEGAK